jgi:hypothetical protein
MKVLRIDENAHAILIKVRDGMQSNGIENATISDAIRELDRQASIKPGFDYVPKQDGD